MEFIVLNFQTQNFRYRFLMMNKVIFDSEELSIIGLIESVFIAGQLKANMTVATTWKRTLTNGYIHLSQRRFLI